ncbi:MAG: hypothetical protein R3B93_26780 [Bacteroidia bacterium]
MLHTESVGKILFLEGWLNTPSAHRVHHGSNPKYIDKLRRCTHDLGSLFGTYQAEEEEVVYGVTTGFEGHNPVWAVFWADGAIFRGNFKGRSGMWRLLLTLIKNRLGSFVFIIAHPQPSLLFETALHVSPQSPHKANFGSPTHQPLKMCVAIMRKLACPIISQECLVQKKEKIILECMVDQVNPFR